ncbi:MAG: polysaccharide biosynthesis protein [Bacteroidota bacterium]
MSRSNVNHNFILITGSTGYVCTHLVSRLLASTKYNIVVTYRTNRGNYNNNDRLTFKKADLLESNSFDYIFANYQIKHVIHLAAMARVSDGENYPEKVIAANLVATINLAKLSVKYNIRSMIFTSSNLAQDAVSVVGLGKLLAEQYFQKIDSNFTRFISLRMPNVIDSNGSVTLIFSRLINENKSITITHPEMSRLFITGEQSAEVLNFLMGNGIDKAVCVSYDKPIKIIDLAQSMILASGKKLDTKFIGMKSGEKLTEKYFTKNEIIPANFPKLGMIKNYKCNINIVESAIESLNKKHGILSNALIQNIFSEIGQSF